MGLGLRVCRSSRARLLAGCFWSATYAVYGAAVGNAQPPTQASEAGQRAQEAQQAPTQQAPAQPNKHGAQAPAAPTAAPPTTTPSGEARSPEAAPPPATVPTQASAAPAEAGAATPEAPAGDSQPARDGAPATVSPAAAVPPATVTDTIETSDPSTVPATAVDDGVVTTEDELDEMAAVEAVMEQPAPEDTGEMVVTADRRRKSLQQYAGAASAISQRELEQQGITSIRNLTAATPSVQLGTQEGNTEIFIRGIGSSFNTELGDPAAAMHFDGVYIPRPRGVGSMLYDIERLEISRGPQGTLRGRNATAGAVNVITNAPVLEEWLADTSLQLGNYSQRLGRAMVNVPVGNKLALRLAAYHETRDPLFSNAGPISTLLPSESADVLSYRASGLWQPLKNLKILLRHDRTQEGGTGATGSNFAPALRAGLTPEDVPDPRAVVYRGAQGSQDILHWGASAEATLDLGPFSIGYIGSYRDLDYQQVVGGNIGVAYPGMDMADLDNWSTEFWHTTSESIVQELRIYAPDDARFRWSVGGFFFNESQQVFLGSAADQSSGYAGFEYNHPDMKSRSYAGYADATYDILKILRATAGLRYTSESKKRDGIGYQYRLDGLSSDTNFRFGTEGFRFRGLDRTDYSTGTSASAQVEDFLNGVATYGARDTLTAALDRPGARIAENSLQEQHGKYDGQFVDFRLGADLDITKDNLVYVKVSTGHQSGGFNDTIVFPTGKTVAPTYEPEVIYATEVGSKNKLLDGKLIANVAAFWYQYDNQQFSQVQALFPTDVTGTSAGSLVRFNAATSRVLGLEADITAHLPAGFRLDLAGLLLDAQVTDGVVSDSRSTYAPDEEDNVDLAGKRLPRAPLLSVNYGIRQELDTSVGTFYWLARAQTKTRQYMTIFNGRGRDTQGNTNPNLWDVVPGYTVLDASIGYVHPDGGLKLDLIGTNLTDTVYMTSLINNPDQNKRYFNLPRQVALRMTLLM